MFRLIALPALLALFFTVAVWTQPPVADTTAGAGLGALLAGRKFEAAAAHISATGNPALRASQWEHFEAHTLALAEAHYNADAFEKAIGVLDTTLRLLAQAGRADSFPTAEFWTWKALTCRGLERYVDALDAYQEAIRIYEQAGYNGPAFAFCYKNAAQIYIRRQDYLQADKYLKAAIRSDSTGWDLAAVYGQLANNAYWQDSLEQAFGYFKKGKPLAKERGDLATLASVGSSILAKKGQWVLAESLMRQALGYYRDNPDEGENRIRCYTSLAEIAARTGRAREAENLYVQAEKEGQAHFQGRKSREMAKLYTEWGDFMFDAGRAPKALHLYQKAIIQAYPAFDDPDPAHNPKPGDAPLELWALYAPARKATLLLRQPAPAGRATAADCFDLAFAAADRLRRAYGTDEAKLYLNQRNVDLRREAVRNLWAMHQAAPNAGHLNRLFHLLEDGRANTLRDALHQQRALALSDVPDSLLQLEASLRLGIAEIYAAGSANDSIAMARRQAALFQSSRRYDALFNYLKKNYPQFNGYVNAGATAALPAIRRALPATAALLVWFDAGDRYLCLALRRSGLSAYDVPRDTALDQALNRFLSLLPDKQRQEAHPDACFSDAYFLKQRLLPDAVLAGVHALVVVPDGQLAYLPFEALLTAPHRGAYGTAPYLLHSHPVQYAWSAAGLAEAPLRKLRGKGLLQIAPFAAGARTGLATLPNSLREKPEYLEADLLQGDRANGAAFLQGAAHYNVLHLSTHAHAGLRTQPGIEFYDRTVWLPEIYAQRLQASLVNLSACETSAGAFADGEGVLSLARAFAYAGAQSLIASHWSVSDRSTAAMFAAMYRHLKSGLSKSEALQQAKLDLLAADGADARKAPYHWAAFTLSGADGTVELASSAWPWWVWGAAGLGVCAAAAGLLFKRRKAGAGARRKSIR
ncbi:MAG: CHAT domain-containing protein [Saprospirales bacterium]|nr:CHAT domain-containing protein [Saprospirales bacterium]MBK8922277.1 CHAT domain-containing protein [Saprospirales bacterium]